MVNLIVDYVTINKPGNVFNCIAKKWENAIKFSFNRVVVHGKIPAWKYEVKCLLLGHGLKAGESTEVR